MSDLYAPAPSPADMPPRRPSPDAAQREAIRDLVTGLTIRLNADADPDLDAIEVLARLIDAQTRSKEADLRRAQFFAAKATAQ